MSKDRPKRRWSPKEQNFLIHNFSEYSPQEIAAKLDRTPVAVREKFQILKHEGSKRGDPRVFLAIQQVLKGQKNGLTRDAIINTIEVKGLLGEKVLSWTTAFTYLSHLEMDGVVTRKLRKVTSNSGRPHTFWILMKKEENGNGRETHL